MKISKQRMLFLWIVINFFMPSLHAGNVFSGGFPHEDPALIEECVFRLTSSTLMHTLSYLDPLNLPDAQRISAMVQGYSVFHRSSTLFQALSEFHTVRALDQALSSINEQYISFISHQLLQEALITRHHPRLGNFLTQFNWRQNDALYPNVNKMNASMLVTNHQNPIRMLSIIVRLSDETPILVLAKLRSDGRFSRCSPLDGARQLKEHITTTLETINTNNTDNPTFEIGNAIYSAQAFYQGIVTFSYPHSPSLLRRVNYLSLPIALSPRTNAQFTLQISHSRIRGTMYVIVNTIDNAPLSVQALFPNVEAAELRRMARRTAWSASITQYQLNQIPLL